MLMPYDIVIETIGGVTRMKKLILMVVLAALLMSGCAQSTIDESSVDSTLSSEELRIKEDLEMYDSLIMRFMDADPNALNEKQLTVAALITFDAEMMNGGLCQFFVNSSRDVAPYVVESLNAIGAINYKILLNDFVEEHNINLSDLDSFMIEDVEEFEAQTERYPFDDFDDNYYELYEKEPLEDLLISYAKKHLEDFKMD